MPPWWDIWQGRLEYELQQLDQAGIVYKVDESSLKAGIAKIELQVQQGGELGELVAVFPDLYPEVRFEVFAPQLDLPLHQNPFSKNLCLIGRDTSNWRPSYTLANFVTNQLPKVLEAARTTNSNDVAGIEQLQAELFSEYYDYPLPAMILVDSSWSIEPSVPSGKLVLALDSGPPEIRGAVLEVRDEAGRTLAKASDGIRKRYEAFPPIEGRWVRCESPIHQADADGFVDDLGRRNPKILDAQWQKLDRGVGRWIDLIGVVFPEEIAWRESGDGWVFLARVRQKVGRDNRRALVRPGYAGIADMSARVPELSSLIHRSVAVFGLGALGMPSAIALARAGVGQLRVLDFDFADPAASARWPFGIGAAGLPKNLVLERFLAADYPHTEVASFGRRLGATRRPDDLSDLEVIDVMMHAADLVYDATAEEGLHPLLERLARERGIPYVCISGTNGAWGGTIVRTQLDTGCWHCFLAAQDDERIPLPVEAPTSFVQPAGCGSPTFTGAGFDLDQVSTLGVRYTVGALSLNDGEYPAIQYDVAIGNFRDDEGQSILPRWEGFMLAKRLDCPICGT